MESLEIDKEIHVDDLKLLDGSTRRRNNVLKVASRARELGFCSVRDILVFYNDIKKNDWLEISLKLDTSWETVRRFMRTLGLKKAVVPKKRPWRDW